MAMFNKDRFEAVKTDWETPQYLFDELTKEFNFSLDVAASSENAKTKRYFTVLDNGLTKVWENEIVWCNPPYGTEVPKWLQKGLLSKSLNTTSVFLIPARTNTKWWHSLCMKASEIDFICGRPKFGESTHGLPFPLALIIFKPNVDTLTVGSFFI
jgi:phage N-6-adenine-methyltransferase